MGNGTSTLTDLIQISKLTMCTVYKANVIEKLPIPFNEHSFLCDCVDGIDIKM